MDVLIKGLDREIVETLEAMATINGRSRMAEIRTILADACNAVREAKGDDVPRAQAALDALIERIEASESNLSQRLTNLEAMAADVISNYATAQEGN